MMRHLATEKLEFVQKRDVGVPTSNKIDAQSEVQ